MSTPNSSKPCPYPVGVVLSGVRSGAYYNYRDTDYNYVRKSTSPSST